MSRLIELCSVLHCLVACVLCVCLLHCASVQAASASAPESSAVASQLLTASQLDSVSLQHPPSAEAPVLVLGSGGLIGTALVHLLQQQGYTVLEVKSRLHIDLRVQPSLLPLHFNLSTVQFAFFLACEVGGSKFIDNARGSVQLDILQNNLRIYDSVLPTLVQYRIPTLFTSSHLQSQPTSYGVVKRLGERLLDAYSTAGTTAQNENAALFRSVRLWNVFGPEKLSLKSHVINDWIDACLSSKHEIRSLTDGHERRQFMHVNDTAAALVGMMHGFTRLSPVTELSSRRWHSMREIAHIIGQMSPQQCTVAFSDKLAVARDVMEPNTDSSFWHERMWSNQDAPISLETGVRQLYALYQAQRASAASAHVYQSIPSTLLHAQHAEFKPSTVAEAAAALNTPQQSIAPHYGATSCSSDDAPEFPILSTDDEERHACPLHQTSRDNVCSAPTTTNSVDTQIVTH